ncbi:MAG: hypothetical protein INQ03_04310 [Candidatus Heimdallarchaeota archaeon]|nr:hypothetical protein [Candidatus Heimdallarchaeota archaeon]
MAITFSKTKPLNAIRLTKPSFMRLKKINTVEKHDAVLKSISIDEAIMKIHQINQFNYR